MQKEGLSGSAARIALVQAWLLRPSQLTDQYSRPSSSGLASASQLKMASSTAWWALFWLTPIP
jgi:hypothetical protein